LIALTNILANREAAGFPIEIDRENKILTKTRRQFDTRGYGAELAWLSEENPMLMRFRNLVLLSTALCTTAAFAAEQKTVDVPFSFVAKNHAYEAGAYSVAVDWTRSMVTLRKIGKPSQSMTWILMPAANDSHPRVGLTFDVAGSNHVLRTIQYETLATPNLDKQPKHKVEDTTRIGE
jgi:hypothetical protein